MLALDVQLPLLENVLQTKHIRWLNSWFEWYRSSFPAPYHHRKRTLQCFGPLIISWTVKCGFKLVRNECEMDLKVVEERLQGLRGLASFHYTLLSTHCIFSFPSWTKERWSLRKRPGSPWRKCGQISCCHGQQLFHDLQDRDGCKGGCWEAITSGRKGLDRVVYEGSTNFFSSFLPPPSTHPTSIRDGAFWWCADSFTP